MARNGKLDPIIGRDEEIRRTIQILSRRTKSNPVLIGPPGVGKTAILEGLASRIVSKEVPESLQDKRVLSIDLSAIMAGSGIRGQFEEKFKALIRDIEDEAGKVICFIDEVHTLFNLGKSEGSIDAGQMIKPALARGLQLVGATTPDEYRKTIGKDAALERRFQPVSIDEPTVESTISILRGLKSRYEVHHGVEISDGALAKQAAVYGARYISDRFLPDKAIDLVDEAASSLRLAQESKPDALEALNREIITLQIELESLKNETDVFSVERRLKVEEELKAKKGEAEALTSLWQAERARLDRIKDIKQRLEEAKHQLEVSQRQGKYDVASRLRFSTIPDLERQLPAEGEAGQEDLESPLAMLHDRVTSNDISRVVAKSTGIPVQNLLKGERDKLVHMEDTLRQRVVGQDHVVAAISDAVRISRAGLQAPNRPVASFLFLGPTGVGKTELCKALAAFLFNDEQRGLININMSEYHDRHTISRLIGAAPGYVGFEEGGQLTEAVRRKPYAVILLDELEKAHKDVAMILLQILDEGSITDSQGRKVDFKNTIICLTSNLGSDILAHSSACDADGVVNTDAKNEVFERVSEHFPPELLNRLDSMLVFNKLSRQSILEVVSLRLKDVADRLRGRRITLDVDNEARDWLAGQGYSQIYGARAIARVVRSDVLFPMAQKLLRGTIRDGDTVKIRVSEDKKSLIIYENHDPDPTAHNIPEEGNMSGKDFASEIGLQVSVSIKRYARYGDQRRLNHDHSHVFGQAAKKEYNIENVKVTNSAWDTNIVSASGQYLSVNWNASGGGAFAIIPLPSPFGTITGFPHKLPDTLPLARSHTAAVLDTDWSPHNDSIVASGGEDGKVMIWKVEASAFEDWGSENWVPQDFDPVARIEGSPRKIGQVLFHPTAANVLASASGEHTVKLWDLANTEAAKSVLTGHGDAIQSMAYNPTGTLLATTCRDRKLRLFDPRTGGEAVRIVDGHGGVKGSRVAWMGDLDKIATTGFSKMSDRQVGIWETGGLGNVKTMSLDQSSGVVMPFWSDNNILFLAGKGDGNVRYYEYDSDTLHPLSEYKSSDPQRGMCFLPRRALNVGECEIARAYKVQNSYIEPIAFIVPRKARIPADGFQSDIFPPAPSSEPSLSASEFFAGKTAPQNLVDLSSGTSFASTAPPPSIPTPTPTLSLPPPSPAAAPLARSNSYTTPAPSPIVPKPEPTLVAQENFTPSPVVESAQPQAASVDPSVAALKEENARLTGELRDAREKIRNLEVQVESIRANTRKAAEMLQGALH
ncbi:hypothetical protein H0H92_003976 [Tricholoma furcatifolium]|nr:hypothetical protein H0H92_003976 [Tricholoma furcatifolium]